MLVEFTLALDVMNVLILVLMEDTLRDRGLFQARELHQGVLILVLMEDTLREVKNFDKAAIARVLILVLMEDTLRGKT